MVRSGWLATGALAALPAFAAAAALPPRAAYDDAIRCAAIDMIMSGMLEGGEATEADRELSGHYRALTSRWLGEASKLEGKSRQIVLADFEARANAIMARLHAATSETQAHEVLDSGLAGCGEFEKAYISPAAPTPAPASPAP